jgi:stage II sporulation protein D
MTARTVFQAALAGLTSVLMASAWAAQAPAGAPLPGPQTATQDPAADAALEAAGSGRTVRVGTPGGGSVSVMPLEVYVSRVLAGEAAPNTPDGALQALAIAARTYTIANAGRHDREGFDVCDTTHCQVYRAASPATRRAALASAGLVLTYNGVPAEIFYSASCGGRTERASEVWANGAQFPYLVGVDDEVHEGDPAWRLERSLDEIRDAVLRAGARGTRLEDVRIDARSSSGRVSRVGLPGLTPDALTGDQLRAALGFAELRSTAFTIERMGDRLRFDGRGYGHGVGLCVVGAGRRAARGDTAEAILRHYFPMLELRRLAPTKAATAPLGP